MSGFTGSPRLSKGALCQGPLIIPFQYNPETLTRSLTANSVNPQGHTSDVLRLHGPPTETITLEALLDATDDLEQEGQGSAGASAKEYGIYPALTALELLLYPSSARMILNAALAAVGLIEIVPATPLPTLFVWGPRRVVAVKMTQFNITEEQFDASLNPIRARVTLGMQVLTYEDLGMLSVGGALSLRNHILKEQLVAQAYKYGSATALGLASDGLSQAQSVATQAVSTASSALSQIKVF
jgi:hypothetical protein